MGKTVKRVWIYPGATEDSKVCTFMNLNELICDIKANDVRDWCKAVVDLIGEDVLSLTGDDI